MKKSIFLFAILLVGALSLSAAMETLLLGKWYIHSLSVSDTEEIFDDEESAPWMEFKEENVAILGEGHREPKESTWEFDRATNNLTLYAFDDELKFRVVSITDKQLVLESNKDDGAKATMILNRQL